MKGTKKSTNNQIFVMGVLFYISFSPSDCAHVVILVVCAPHVTCCLLYVIKQWNLKTLQCEIFIVFECPATVLVKNIPVSNFMTINFKISPLLGHLIFFYLTICLRESE